MGSQRLWDRSSGVSGGGGLTPLLSVLSSVQYSERLTGKQPLFFCPNQANQTPAYANYHNICRTLQGGSRGHWVSLVGRVNSCHQRHTKLRAWRHSVKSIWLHKFIYADIIIFYKRRLLPNPNQVNPVRPGLRGCPWWMRDSKFAVLGGKYWHSMLK